MHHAFLSFRLLIPLPSSSHQVLSRHAESNLNQAKAKAKEVRSFEALATLEAHKVKDMDLEEAHEAEQALRAARREQAKAVVRLTVFMCVLV